MRIAAKIRAEYARLTGLKADQTLCLLVVGAAKEHAPRALRRRYMRVFSTKSFRCDCIRFLDEPKLKVWSFVTDSCAMLIRIFSDAAGWHRWISNRIDPASA